MVKRRPKIGRHGLPIKTERIIFSLTREEKASIKAASARIGLTTTGYLLGLHREAETERSKGLPNDGMKGAKP